MSAGPGSEELSQVLVGLGSSEREESWDRFLEAYAPLILQVVRQFARDEGSASDCFLFVCQQLRRGRCRRLRHFRADGAASFSTWLRAVVRNLCIDWRRRRLGRRRVFQSVARLPVRDQEVYRCVYEEGLSLGETLNLLRPVFPDLTENEVGETAERIAHELTSRQFWLLSIARPRVESLTSEKGGAEGLANARLADPGPDPESHAGRCERHALLIRALAHLSHRERLLLRLRFEQDLSLEQVAGLTGLGNAQRADRHLKKVLRRLHDQMAEG